MTQIKRIGVLSAAKVGGALYALLGLIFGAFFACVSLIGLAAEFSSEAGDLGAGFGLLIGLCLFPLLYGLMGAIGGAITAVLYNVIAGLLGGLEVELAASGGKMTDGIGQTSV
ncbi:MAG: hypothetical protein R3300_18620 [Candidatus Promineifilaceae bacterium]|nr:hypothetical protein [Candidatus Promineifilaceae bacterium]